MARFEPGQSGNPKGRPPKERALTAILEKAGSKKIERDGKEVSRKHILAEMLWYSATTGRLKLEQEDGWLVRAIDTDEWLSIVQFLYKHIDGPPPAEHKLTGDPDQPLQIQNNHAIDSATAGTIFDILTSAGVFASASGDAETDAIHPTQPDA